MVLPASGTLGLTTVQAEFGGTNPIGMSEYYRGAGYTTNNNTNVPTSGAIATSNFYSGYRTASISELTTAIKNTTYSLVRNQLISRTSFAVGLETSAALTFNSSTSATYRSSSSVTGTYTWPTSYDASFLPLLNTSYVTFIMRNVANGTLTNSLTVNGSSVTLTDLVNGSISGVNIRMSVGYVPVSYGAMAGLSVSATYTKGTSNNENLQELFVLPGKWDLVSAVASSATMPAAVGTAVAGDIALSLRAGQYDAYFDAGQWGGTSGRTEILRRNSRWYDNTSSQLCVIDTGGTLTYTPGRHQVINSSGTVTATYNWSSYSTLFRCSVV